MLQVSNCNHGCKQEKYGFMVRHWPAEQPAQAVSQRRAWPDMPNGSLHALRLLCGTAPVGGPAGAACAAEAVPREADARTGSLCVHRHTGARPKKALRKTLVPHAKALRVPCAATASSMVCSACTLIRRRWLHERSPSQLAAVCMLISLPLHGY